MNYHHSKIRITYFSKNNHHTVFQDLVLNGINIASALLAHVMTVSILLMMES